MNTADTGHGRGTVSAHRVEEDQHDHPRSDNTLRGHRPSLLAVSRAKGRASTSSTSSAILQLPRSSSSTQQSPQRWQDAVGMEQSSRSEADGTHDRLAHRLADSKGKGKGKANDDHTGTMSRVQDDRSEILAGGDRAPLERDGLAEQGTSPDEECTHSQGDHDQDPPRRMQAYDSDNDTDDSSHSLRQVDQPGSDNDDDADQALRDNTQLGTDPRTRLREQLRRDNVRASRYGTTAWGSSSNPSLSGSASPLPSATSMASIHRFASTSASETRSRKDSQGVTMPTPSSADASQGNTSRPERASRPRRYFVLTSAGKPVFASGESSNVRQSSRSKAELGAKNLDAKDGLQPAGSADASEERLTSLVGVVQAIVSLYAVDNDRIRYIHAGRLRIAFLLKGPIYLVAVSEWEEPESVLRVHLEYLYMQILSTISHAQLQSIFAKHSNFDLRRLLEGTDVLMDGLLDHLQLDFQCLLASLQVMPLEPSVREECVAALRLPPVLSESKRAQATGITKAATSSVLYALMLSGTEIVSLLRPKTHSIHPSDLHILLNVIRSSSALRVTNTESWLPICLPKFNAKGFVYAFICFFSTDTTENASQHPKDERTRSIASDTATDTDKHQPEEKYHTEDIGIVLVTADKEGFFDMRHWKDVIHTRVHEMAKGRTPLISRLQSNLQTPVLYSDISSTISPVVRHFIYKSRTHVQIVQPPYHGIYASSLEDKLRLITIYQQVRETLVPTKAPGHASRSTSGARLVYVVGSHEAVLGVINSSHEMYLAFPALVPKKIATDAAHALSRWCSKHEHTLFLTSAPHL